MSKTYKVTATLAVEVEDGARVAQDPASVAQAVRDYLLRNLPANSTSTVGGYRFVLPIYVTGEEA